MASRRYARSTEVTSDRTLTQIKALVEKFGADGFMFGTKGKQATLGFTYHGRSVRWDLIMPDPEDNEFTETPTGLERSESSARKAWEQACRAKWRGLFLLIKALLNAVEEGLIPFDRAFFYDIVTPTGKTIGQQIHPQVHKMIESGQGGPLLLEMTPHKDD